MPEISRFLGIVIAMFYRDHAPAHFHAIYGEYEITVDIGAGVVHGDFPKRALRLVFEWLDLHREELLEDWRLAEARRPLKKIAPLEWKDDTQGTGCETCARFRLAPALF